MVASAHDEPRTSRAPSNWAYRLKTRAFPGGKASELRGRGVKPSGMRTQTSGEATSKLRKGTPVPPGCTLDKARQNKDCIRRGLARNCPDGRRRADRSTESQGRLRRTRRRGRITPAGAARRRIETRARRRTAWQAHAAVGLA